MRSADIAPMLAFTLERLGAGRTATVELPAVNVTAQRLLWGAGFQLAGPVGLIGSSRPFGRFDRYVLAGNVLL